MENGAVTGAVSSHYLVLQGTLLYLDTMTKELNRQLGPYAHADEQTGRDAIALLATSGEELIRHRARENARLIVQRFHPDDVRDMCLFYEAAAAAQSQVMEMLRDTSTDVLRGWAKKFLKSDYHIPERQIRHASSISIVDSHLLAVSKGAAIEEAHDSISMMRRSGWRVVFENDADGRRSVWAERISDRFASVPKRANNNHQ